MNIYLILIALLFAVTRFFVPTHSLSPSGSYEAFAHLLVGGLIGAFLASKEKPYLWLAIFLTVVELTAFFAIK